MLVKTKVLATAAALLATLVVPLPAAQGLTDANEGHRVSVVSTARHYLGVPYCHGGSTPKCFDCSGLTKYVYKKAGHNLAHSADAQYRATKHISKSKAKPGDLVFFMSGNYAYHVGIYMGHGKVLHSPKTGHRVRIERIWTSNVRYGRV